MAFCERQGETLLSGPPWLREEPRPQSSCPCEETWSGPCEAGVHFEAPSPFVHLELLREGDEPLHRQRPALRMALPLERNQ